MPYRAFAQLTDNLLAHAHSHIWLTPNERLPREYATAYNEAMRNSGKRTWATLQSLSLNKWLNQEWCRFEEQNFTKLRIVDRSEMLAALYAAATPDQRAQTISALDAWNLCLRYRIDWDDDAFARNDLLPFRDWCARAQTSLGQNVLLGPAIPEYLSSHRFSSAQPLLLIAFEHLAPAELSYLSMASESKPIKIFNNHKEIVDFYEYYLEFQESSAEHHSGGLPNSSRQCADNPALIGYACLEEEVAAAADWIKATLNTEPDATCIVVMPQLAQHYASTQRQFAAIFDPERGSLTDTFDLSGGVSLGLQPVWQHARMLLDWCVHPRGQARASALAHSPFLNYRELAALFQTESGWPTTYRQTISLQHAFGRALSISRNEDLSLPEDQQSKGLEQNTSRDAITATLESAQSLPVEATLSAWAETIMQLLRAAGWPGSPALNSVQFQAAERVLGSLQSTAEQERYDDHTEQRFALSQALEYFDLIIGQQMFAPERPAGQVRVLGALETTGLSCSHLWVCGLGEDSYPQVAAKNPFIPKQLAIRHGLPRADATADLAFAERQIRHWLSMAETTRISFTHTENNEAIAPSPLLLGALQERDSIPELTLHPPILPEQLHPYRVRQSTVLERYVDDYGSALDEQSVSGGIGRLEDQALCPMRSFAKHRLNLRDPRTPFDFLDPLERGTQLHAILQALATPNTTQAALVKLDSTKIGALCHHVLSRSGSLPERFIENEVERLITIIATWLQLEAQRQPFEIKAVEQKTSLEIAGLQFNLRLDRIDLTASGEVVIDYKTGNVNLSAATQTPLLAPQLAIYSLTADAIHGVCFAKLKSDDVKLTGIVDPGTSIVEGRARGITIKNPQSNWTQQKSIWREQLESLANELREGNATVNPAPTACRYCHLHSFCRIQTATNMEESNVTTETSAFSEPIPFDSAID